MAMKQKMKKEADCTTGLQGGDSKGISKLSIACRGTLGYYTATNVLTRRQAYFPPLAN